MVCIVEIISIGNELLIGKTLNTSSQWLAKYITTSGGKVKRIHTVADDLDEFSSALHDSLSRKPTLIITTGGLGPTFDDKTLEAIAAALNIPLEINEEALHMIQVKYHQYEISTGKKIELTPSRLKMAKLPIGAKPIENPIGTAPGILLKYNSSRIVALPGVPNEMEAIFENNIIPIIKKAAGNIFINEKSLIVTEIIESELAPLLDKVMHDNPYVYIKSHPKAAEPIPLLELHITTASKSQKDAETYVETAAEQLSRKIFESGGKVN